MKHPFLLRLALYGWRAGLLLVAITTALVLTFGSPSDLKSALQGSGAYDQTSEVLATSATERASNITDLPPNDGEVDQASRQTFTPDAIRGTAEQTIDSTYAWLDGTTPNSDIRIDTSAYVDKFAGNLSDKVTGKLETVTRQSNETVVTKPACTNEQLQQLYAQYQAGGLDLSSLDVSTLPCSPSGAVTEVITRTIQEQTQGETSDELQSALRDNALPFNTGEQAGEGSETDIIIDGQKAAYLPSAYQWAMRGPWLAGILALLSGLAVVLMTRGTQWMEGVRRLARSLLTVGIILAILAVVSRLVMSLLDRPDSSIGRVVGGDFAAVFVNFVSALEKQLDSTLFIFGVCYATIGVALLAYIRWRTKQNTLVSGAGEVTARR